MRIVYLNPVGRLGGAETSLRELLAGVRAAAPEWDLTLVLGEDGPLAPLAREMGVTVVLAPFPRALARLGDGTSTTLIHLLRAVAATVSYSHGLARLLKQIRPDVIHTNGFKMHLLGAWTRPKGTPLVWHIHDYVSSRRLMRRLLWPFRKACRVAIANSDSVASDLSCAFPGLRAVRIYNAVDLNRFSPTGKSVDLDAVSGLPPATPGTIRVGLLATFARWKGHEIFLDALAQLPRDLPVRGYIIGGPIYQTDGSQWTLDELKRKAEALQLTGSVGFAGFLEDNAAAIRGLDVLVHASTVPEPFGMVIIEGMACGKPVIVSQAGGAAELFADGENALGHPPGDARALAQQIQRLSRDESLRVRLGRAARATAEQHYHNKGLSTELVQLYRQCASRAAKLGPPVTSSLPAAGN